MDKRQDAGFLIKQISEKTDKKIIRTFKKYGVTCSQHRLLVFLDKSGGKSTQKDVETYLEVSHPTVVGLLSGLESRGLVSCVFDSGDKRMKSVYLTDEGSALLKSSCRDAIDVGKEFWKDISDEEIETLIAILEKLKGNLNND